MDRHEDEKIASSDKSSSNSSQSSRSVSTGKSTVLIHNTSDDEALLYLQYKKPSSSDSEGEVRSRKSDVEEGETVGNSDGAVDIEDGEIDDVSNFENLEKYSCRFYQRGRCIWGKECRFLHLSDKGMYTMLDSPVKHKQVPQQMMCFVNGANFAYQPHLHEPDNRIKSIWDEALIEAKERVRQSKMRKDDPHFEAEDCWKITRDVQKSLNRPTLPEPTPERVVCAFPKRWKKYEKKNSSEAIKPEIRKIHLRKVGCDTEWRDPWRRSKTPPRRKRFRSRSFSISSKSSQSCSSLDTTSRSPSSRRFRCKSPCVRDCVRKWSPRRPKISSCSFKGSTSSSEWTPKKVSIRKRRSPSRRRKRHHSSERVLLPYKRRSSSFSSPVVTKRKRSDTPSKKNSRSPSSSRSSVRQEPPLPRSSNRSCSDMSISPNSYSSSPKVSAVVVVPPAVSNFLESDPDKNSCQNSRALPILDVKIKITPKEKQLNSTKMELLNIDSSGVSGSVSNLRHSCQSNRAPPILDAKTKKTFPRKNRISFFEMELLKYQADFRKTMPRSAAGTAPARSRPPNVTSTTHHDIVEKGASSAIISKSASNGIKHKNKPSKRDLLMQQLRAVEEAIARKKKSTYSM